MEAIAPGEEDLASEEADVPTIKVDISIPGESAALEAESLASEENVAPKVESLARKEKVAP